VHGGSEKIHTKFYVGDVRGGNSVDVDGAVILQWILKTEQYYLLDSAGPGLGPVTGSRQCYIELSDFFWDIS
jgi:hypothetical protein